MPNNDSALLDLSSLQSVKDFSAAVLDSGKPLNVLLNNAGVMALPNREETADGFEYQLGVNHLGHAALTWRLLPLLLDTAVAVDDEEAKQAVRVVTVASSAHQFGKIDFADLNFRESAYSAWGAYGQSKLANVLFAYELARRTMDAPGSNRFTSNALHPGVVKTELARYLFGKCFFSFFLSLLIFVVVCYPRVEKRKKTHSNSSFFFSAPLFHNNTDPNTAGPLGKLAALLTSPFLKTPEQGAQTSIYLASSRDVEGVSGKYFVDSSPRASNPASYDLDTARKLWEVTKELVGVDPDAAIAAVAGKKEKAVVV